MQLTLSKTNYFRSLLLLNTKSFIKFSMIIITSRNTQLYTETSSYSLLIRKVSLTNIN